MMQNGIMPLIFYCNPNIYPEEEYLIRKDECTRYAKSLGLEIVDADYNHEQWLSEMKGRYTYTDMNRVELAVRTLSARLTELGYRHPSLSIKTNWSVGDTPTKADFDRYFGNVAALRSVIAVPGSTPETPTTEKRFGYLLANDLEKILEAIDAGTSKIQKPWIFSGDIFAGEV
jgi:hypothetical protein